MWRGIKTAAMNKKIDSIIIGEFVCIHNEIGEQGGKKGPRKLERKEKVWTFATKSELLSSVYIDRIFQNPLAFGSK